MQGLVRILLIIVFNVHWASNQLEGNSTIAGNLEVYTTIHSIGFEWDIIGDDNHNATCMIQFRKNTTDPWSMAMPAYRVDFEGFNMFAGSILFLKPGTSYEVQMVLSDTDGGSSTINQTVSTRPIPQKPSSGQTYHVIPGSGGGNGTFEEPFKGINAAEMIAQPGDLFLLHAGNYGGVINFNTGGSVGNYIAWIAAGDGEVVFKGIRIETDYLWFEGLTIVDQQYGLRTSPPGPIDIVVTRCKFYNNHYSIYLNDGGSGWYITDNIIVGDNDPNVSNFSGEGIELNHTSNHTVAFNTISRVGDGISYPHKNVDIFGNEIFDTSDDGIEFDYGHANNRSWKNRITNALNNGISFQPMNAAPFYILYNQVSVLNESVLKLRTRSDRALIAHNTFVAKSGPVGYGAHLLEPFEIKNNLWISIEDRYVWENGVHSNTNWRTDFDYDGFDWGTYPYAFKWGSNVRITDIPEFNDSTGQEVNGIQINYLNCIDTIEFQGSASTVDSFFIDYYQLRVTCNAIDAGTPLPNINDGYLGVAPDLGAYETGQPLPHYGIRPRCQMITTNKWIGPLSGHWHDNISYWSENRFPESCDHVLIGSGYTVKIEAGQIGKAYTLEIQLGAELESEGSGQLEIVQPK